MLLSHALLCHFRCAETQAIRHQFRSYRRIGHALAAGSRKSDTINDAETTDGYESRKSNIRRERSENSDEDVIDTISSSIFR
jgi:hypothetical protein